jgi:hypothetical protein
MLDIQGETRKEAKQNRSQTFGRRRATTTKAIAKKNASDCAD